MKVRVLFTINADNKAGIHHGNIESKITGVRPDSGKAGHFYREFDDIPRHLPEIIVDNTTVVEITLNERGAVSKALHGRYAADSYEAEVTACTDGAHKRNIRISKVRDVDILRLVYRQLMTAVIQPTKAYATNR